jgi:Yip1 domain
MNDQVPENSSAVADQFLPMLDIFIDPASAVRRIDRKAPWLVPISVIAIGAVVISYLLMPVTLQVMSMNPPANIPREQYQRSFGMIEKALWIGAFASPVLVALKLLILAGILKLMATLGGLDVVFKKLFSFLSNAAMIIFLEGLATFAVIKAKGDEIQTMEEMMPALGLDLLSRGQLPKTVEAGLHFFSIFEIWYIVVLVVGFAALAKCSKSKAFLLTLPVWLVPMLFMVVSAMFRP